MLSRMQGQVLVLASAQALFQTASVMVMTVGGLAGGLIASRPELATMPIAAMFLGTALATFPASMWMARVGRRAGFVGGALLGAVGGLVAAAGIWAGSLLLLSLGTFLVGAYQAFAQFYRFAAGEVADDAFRPRAISLVLAGGIVAAFAGPMVGRLAPTFLGRPMRDLSSCLRSFRSSPRESFSRSASHLPQRPPSRRPPPVRCCRSCRSQPISSRSSELPPATV